MLQRRFKRDENNKCVDDGRGGYVKMSPSDVFFDNQMKALKNCMELQPKYLSLQKEIEQLHMEIIKVSNFKETKGSYVTPPPINAKVQAQKDYQSKEYQLFISLLRSKCFQAASNCIKREPKIFASLTTDVKVLKGYIFEELLIGQTLAIAYSKGINLQLAVGDGFGHYVFNGTTHATGQYTDAVFYVEGEGIYYSVQFKCTSTPKNFVEMVNKWRNQWFGRNGVSAPTASLLPEGTVVVGPSDVVQGIDNEAFFTLEQGATIDDVVSPVEGVHSPAPHNQEIENFILDNRKLLEKQAKILEPLDKEVKKIKTHLKRANKRVRFDQEEIKKLAEQLNEAETKYSNACEDLVNVFEKEINMKALESFRAIQENQNHAIRQVAKQGAISFLLAAVLCIARNGYKLILGDIGWIQMVIDSSIQMGLSAVMIGLPVLCSITSIYISVSMPTVSAFLGGLSQFAGFAALAGFFVYEIYSYTTEYTGGELIANICGSVGATVCSIFATATLGPVAGAGIGFVIWVVQENIRNFCKENKQEALMRRLDELEDQKFELMTKFYRITTNIVIACDEIFGLIYVERR
eukprot:GHVP01057389.1.p1 GENE.GHVP01057389.1~~GHVP01057389.1.p1  ORF type:complete len:577 (-),score=99.12 GHVP01057389.1:679-2409(-)